MLREYQVMCMIKANSELVVVPARVYAEDENGAKILARRLLEAADDIDKIISVGAVSPRSPGVIDNGPATQSDIDSWKLHCKKYNINTNIN